MLNIYQIGSVLATRKIPNWQFIKIPKWIYNLIMKFLNNLQVLAESRGLTQAALAKLTGISSPEITRWWHGYRRLPQDKAEKLAEVIGCTVSELYPGEVSHAKIEDDIGALQPDEKTLIKNYRRLDKTKKALLIFEIMTE